MITFKSWTLHHHISIYSLPKMEQIYVILKVSLRNINAHTTVTSTYNDILIIYNIRCVYTTWPSITDTDRRLFQSSLIRGQSLKHITCWLQYRSGPIYSILQYNNQRFTIPPLHWQDKASEPNGFCQCFFPWSHCLMRLTSGPAAPELGSYWTHAALETPQTSERGPK